MRILLVEDEPKIAKAVKKGLEQESYAVDALMKGGAGLRYALTEPYDLVILDRMLPGIEDGLQICAQMREKGIKTPVLMLTARDGLLDRVSGLNSGADDYLVKPFAFSELLARVRALLRRPYELQGPVLQIGDLSLNPQTAKVERQGKAIRLSKKEFALLEYFMRRPGRVLNKDEIIAHVWDFDADILPNTVEAYVGYLRKKIEEPFSGPALIQTVRGFGYCFGKEK